MTVYETQTTTSPHASDEETQRLFFLIAGGILFFRLGILLISAAELGPDESQYWYWSQDPAFGYFSKPPMIAWLIAATTGIFGHAEWATRLAAPFLHLGTAVFIYLTADMLYDRRTAFWAGLTWMLVPGVILSSFLITTDAPLLLFWSASIWVTTKILKTDDAPITLFAMLGVSIALGFLSKYAMVYFPLALGATAFIDARFRRKFIAVGGLCTGIIAALLIAPNIWWNLSHDMSTLSHTAANANWSGSLFHPISGLTFLMEQFGVAGIVPVGAFVWLTYSRLQLGSARKLPAHEVLFFLLALIPLLIVAAQAFISRAHANWAAAAYPAIILLTTPHLLAARKGWLIKANAGLYAIASLIFAIFAAQPSAADLFGFSKPTREIRGWADQSAAIAARADGFDAIAIDDRALMGAMLYYDREQSAEIVAIDPNAGVDHHYEAFKAFDPALHKHMLFVTTRTDAAHVDYRFRKITPLGPVTVTLGREERTYHLFDISDYSGPPLPVRREAR